MSLDPMKSTSLMLNMIAKKQKVLGENLANIDTPGYARKDVDFNQYLGALDGSAGPRIASKMGPCPVVGEVTGGPVNPTTELTEMQKNSLLYTMATRRMSNIITEMKTVINVGK